MCVVHSHIPECTHPPTQFLVRLFYVGFVLFGARVGVCVGRGSVCLSNTDVVVILKASIVRLSLFSGNLSNTLICVCLIDIFYIVLKNPLRGLNIHPYHSTSSFMIYCLKVLCMTTTK